MLATLATLPQLVDGQIRVVVYCPAVKQICPVCLHLPTK